MIRTLREQAIPTTSRSVKIAVALALFGVLFAGLFARPAHAVPTVTNTNDSGPGSLRQAILDANANSNADIIDFSISGSGPHTIAPASALPDITAPVTIDGYSQPGAVKNNLAQGNNAVLKIELSGANAGSVANGLTIKTANSVLKGLVINGWDGPGVEIGGSGATGNKVEGNFIGTDTSGTQDLGNAVDGVLIFDDAHSNTVGGAVAEARNVISGNDAIGVGIAASGNRVEGNYIGTDKSGTAALGNSYYGVIINGANNTVGGPVTLHRNPGNVISANGEYGVIIALNISKGNKVQGNYVGTDATGTLDLGNTFAGVAINDAPNNTVGGPVTKQKNARNVISGNDGNGVNINLAGATGNQVQGNYIGTDKNGTADLGNSSDGVIIDGASNNTVGGTATGAGNVISGNGTPGVSIGGAAKGNSILSNSIDANGSLGIDLGSDGVTKNDKKDPDKGPNNLQNFPVISSATTGNKTTIQGTLNSTPGKKFTIQFFSSPQADPSGFGEGQTFIGQTKVKTGSDGKGSFTFKPAQAVALGKTVTATATDPGGNTSEFSKAAATCGGDPSTC